MTKQVRVCSIRFGGGAPLALIAGPCVIESRAGCLDLAGKLARLARAEQIPFIFKASFDKANRTSLDSYRGPGLIQGLEILREVKEKFGVPILTDIHEVAQVAPAAKVADILQIPAFLCRQTDLLLAAGRSGAVVNIKKGQFLAPRDMRHALTKIESTGNRRILVTERGASFGYNNLVADMRSLLLLRELGYPVIFDATHSVQLPGGQGASSGGERQFVPLLARAAVAAGVDAVFMEVHPCPDKALCDGPNCWPLDQLEPLLKTLRALDKLAKKSA
jgi:2-dehydro-3-deoxyphosphooctonate aldolase (KDO 8-P synthase)